jgi:hypothetical protein
MPVDVLEVFVLFWVTVISYYAWVTRANLEIDKKLRKDSISE